MRNKILILIPIILMVLVLVGCIPGITPTPEPEEPESVMKAVATAELVEVVEVEAVEAVEAVPAVLDEVTGDVITEAVEAVEGVEEEGYWNVDWAIVNTGDLFIREYILTFTVDYPNVAKDLVTFDVTGKYLEIGKFEKGTVKLGAYGDNENPESVDVTCELFE